jgi:hypothetical protein
MPVGSGGQLPITNRQPWRPPRPRQRCREDPGRVQRTQPPAGPIWKVQLARHHAVHQPIGRKLSCWTMERVSASVPGFAWNLPRQRQRCDCRTRATRPSSHHGGGKWKDSLDGVRVRPSGPTPAVDDPRPRATRAALRPPEHACGVSPRCRYRPGHDGGRWMHPDRESAHQASGMADGTSRNVRCGLRAPRLTALATAKARAPRHPPHTHQLHRPTHANKGMT